MAGYVPRTSTHPSLLIQKNLQISVFVSVFQAFNVVFQKAIDKAEPAEEVKLRVNNLIDCITFSVFIYTTRGLFEKDKLIFTAQVAFQVRNSRINSWFLFTSFIRKPTKANYNFVGIYSLMIRTSQTH